MVVVTYVHTWCPGFSGMSSSGKANRPTAALAVAYHVLRIGIPRMGTILETKRKESLFSTRYSTKNNFISFFLILVLHHRFSHATPHTPHPNEKRTGSSMN